MLGGIFLVSDCATAPQVEAPKAQPAAALAVARLAPYAPDILVRPAVKAECALEQKVPQIVKDKVGALAQRCFFAAASPPSSAFAALANARNAP